MQMTTEARAWLDATVRRVLARHPLGDAERAGITYELMSHLHAAGEARATAAGRGEVTKMDLELALIEAGGEEKLAAAFVQPLARPVERVLFARRAGALALDLLILAPVIFVVHSVLSRVLTAVAGEGPAVPHQGQLLAWLGPFLYHDENTYWLVQLVIALVSAATILAYFTWTESHDGRSLGKRAFGLRVMRADGGPVTPRDAFARSVAKVFPILLALDVAVMLLAFADDKQRASDRVAGTIVVRT